MSFRGRGHVEHLTFRTRWARMVVEFYENGPGLPSLCHVCGYNVAPTDMLGRPAGRWEWYMVHDRVWKAAGPHPTRRGGFLCVGCLESRLGRHLNPSDFTDAPVNHDPDDSHYASSYRTPRLREALNRPRPSVLAPVGDRDPQSALF